MEFRQFNKVLQQHVAKFMKGHEHLFITDVDMDELWNLYLDSFPAGMNEIFRERREFDCSCCRHFIKQIGNVVSLRNGEVTSLWDFEVAHDGYQQVINALSTFVKAAAISNALVPFERKIGTVSNVERDENGKRIATWHHFNIELPKSVRIFRKDERATVRGNMRTSRDVLQRSFTEISLDAIDTVLELIQQKSLYRGQEWQKPLQKFRQLHRQFNSLPPLQRANWCWSASLEAGSISRIKNHSIGVLLQDITSGMDLDAAVRRYEKIVAPTNYKRPKAIFTKKMVEEAQQQVARLGFLNSLARRHAKLSDITVNNILWANRDAKSKMSGDPFADLAASVAEKPKNFDRLGEMDIDDFITNVLPDLTGLDIMVENRHSPNFFSLIAPQDRDAKSMLKWPNNFSWAYAGNITDSMKARVKAAGGKVDGDLRFSIQWNDEGDNLDDLDAHCKLPNGRVIYYGNKHDANSRGRLDVDIQRPNGVAVENITWPSRRSMPRGKYTFLVENYAARGASSGFTAEIEFDGKIFTFNHPQPLKHKQRVEVADVIFQNGQFMIYPLLEANELSRNIWNISTMNYHPVTACMFSPNYWDGHQGTGHRHIFFVIDNCKNDETPNGFFNEFLQEDLMKHKRVFEALGSKMRVADSTDQLSGLGFSTTKRNDVIVRTEGKINRAIKLTF